MVKNSFPLPSKTMQVSLHKGSHLFQSRPYRRGEEKKHLASGWEKEQTVPLQASFSSFGPNESTCLSANTAELISKCYAPERK